jgi:hypothetical protein
LLRDRIVICPESEELLELLREIRSEVSEHASVFDVTIAYHLSGAQEDIDAEGFVRAGRVVADVPAGALSLLREIEGPAPLALDGEPEVELLEAASSALKGVISMSERLYYDADDRDG